MSFLSAQKLYVLKANRAWTEQEGTSLIFWISTDTARKNKIEKMSESSFATLPRHLEFPFLWNAPMCKNVEKVTKQDFLWPRHWQTAHVFQLFVVQPSIFLISLQLYASNSRSRRLSINKHKTSNMKQQNLPLFCIVVALTHSMMRKPRLWCLWTIDTRTGFFKNGSGARKPALRLGIHVTANCQTVTRTHTEQWTHTNSGFFLRRPGTARHLTVVFRTTSTRPGYSNAHFIGHSSILTIHASRFIIYYADS